MEIVISVPESWEKCNNTFLRNCIRNGKVLPKGHGALKDADEVFSVMERNFDMQDLYLPIHFKDFALDEAQTIVPADEEGAEE